MWPLVREKSGKFDFSSMSGKSQGILQIGQGIFKPRKSGNFIIWTKNIWVVASVVPIVASYRKLVSVAKNWRQSIEIFLYPLLECRFRWRNASQRISLGEPITDESIGY